MKSFAVIGYWDAGCGIQNVEAFLLGPFPTLEQAEDAMAADLLAEEGGEHDEDEQDQARGQGVLYDNGAELETYGGTYIRWKVIKVDRVVPAVPGLYWFLCAEKEMQQHSPLPKDLTHMCTSYLSVLQ